MFPSALTIGVFDGVHRGHQHLLAQLKATGLYTKALVFTNHPSSVFSSTPTPPLTSFEQKETLIRACGIDEVLPLTFTPLVAAQSYQEFLSLYPCQYLVLGDDAALGKNREGTLDALREFGHQRGFFLHVVEKLWHGGSPISSRRIRALILEGNLSLAAELLGRPYRYTPSKTPENPSTLLPPSGCYPVWLKSSKGLIEAIMHVYEGGYELEGVGRELGVEWVSFGFPT